MILLRDIKEYGITKIAFVVVTLFVFALFLTYILGGFVEMLEKACNAFVPFLACKNSSILVASVGSTMLAIIGPLLSYKLLLKCTQQAGNL